MREEMSQGIQLTGGLFAPSADGLVSDRANRDGIERRVVQTLGADGRCAGCHIIYIDGSGARSPADILDTVRGTPVLRAEERRECLLRFLRNRWRQQELRSCESPDQVRE